MLRQFHPVRDIGVAAVTTVNQVVGTGLSTITQLSAGLANTALSFFNAVPAPPPPPTPPQMSLPSPFGGQQTAPPGQMNITPTGVGEEDFDVVE